MGAEIGTDDRVFQLRAERCEDEDDGNGNDDENDEDEEEYGHQGRIYTVTYEVADRIGNATQVAATVRVPHDKGKKPGGEEE